MVLNRVSAGLEGGLVIAVPVGVDALALGAAIKQTKTLLFIAEENGCPFLIPLCHIRHPGAACGMRHDAGVIRQKKTLFTVKFTTTCPCTESRSG